MNHWFPGQVCVSLRSSHSALAVGWRTHCGFGAGGVVFCGTLRMENWNEMGFWLVVWNISYFPINIGLLIIPIDEVIFFRGGQTTNLCLMDGSSHSSTKKSHHPQQHPMRSSPCPGSPMGFVACTFMGTSQGNFMGNATSLDGPADMVIWKGEPSRPGTGKEKMGDLGGEKATNMVHRPRKCEANQDPTGIKQHTWGKYQRICRICIQCGFIQQEWSLNQQELLGSGDIMDMRWYKAMMGISPIRNRD